MTFSVHLLWHNRRLDHYFTAERTKCGVFKYLHSLADQRHIFPATPAEQRPEGRNRKLSQLCQGLSCKIMPTNWRQRKNLDEVLLNSLSCWRRPNTCQWTRAQRRACIYCTSWGLALSWWWSCILSLVYLQLCDNQFLLLYFQRIYLYI